MKKRLQLYDNWTFLSTFANQCLSSLKSCKGPFAQMSTIENIKINFMENKIWNFQESLINNSVTMTQTTTDGDPKTCPFYYADTRRRHKNRFFLIYKIDMSVI